MQKLNFHVKLMIDLIAIMKVLKFMINLFVTLQVYCVAYNETYKTKFFRKENRGFKSVSIFSVLA